MKRSILFAGFESDSIILPLYIELLANWKVLAYSWRKHGLPHQLFEVFLHLLLFLGEVRVSFLPFRLPSSEMPAEFFLVVELGFTDLEDVGPLFALLLLMKGVFRVKIEFLKGFFNFLDFTLLIILLVFGLILVFSLLFLLFFISLFFDNV